MGGGGGNSRARKGKRSSSSGSNGVVSPVGQRFSPLDRALGLLPGRYTPQVQEAITRLGSRMSYGEAREELMRLWKVKISEGGMRHVTMRHGRVANMLIEEKVAQLEGTAPTPKAQPERMVMCTDGAMVQLTSGEWREVKTVTFGEFEPVWDPKQRKVVTKTAAISYFSRVETAEAFSRTALVEWHRRGGENAQTVVAVQDGALWIQSFIDYHCPQAIRVIDFAHAQEYVATVGRAIHGAETDTFQQWYGRMSKQLGQQPPQRTINELRLLLQQHPDHPETETIEMAIRYLEKRLPMIDYPHFRRRQIPIGSGNVESGHKVVMQKRMKQAGMRWAEANLNPMLALRLSLCNQTWDSSWREIEVRLHQEKYPTRKRLPQKLSTPELITEADCQRMMALADRIKKRKRRPWQNNRWIFPYRENLIHEN
jgi:hypothetical protein